MACLLHLIDHPVPVAGRFEGNLAPRRGGVEEVDVLLAVVVDSNGRCGLAHVVDGHEDRELLVCVTFITAA